ncbi:hypothetical protein B0H13DRAFT_620476 [Mycena leptocephala]|nr:hypothetical protein B0H13DRAFT_620476 [Mycena leptocephala]
MGFLPGSSHHKSSHVFWAQKYSGDTSRRSRSPPVTCQDACILELHSRQTNCTRSCNISRLQMNLDSSPCSTSMGLSHSVLPTQSSIPTAFAPSKLFTRFIQFNWHSTLASATAPGQYVLPPFPPAVIDPTPNQVCGTHIFATGSPLTSSSFPFRVSRCRCVSYHLCLAAPTRGLRRTPSARLPISTSKIGMCSLKAHIPILIQNSPAGWVDRHGELAHIRTPRSARSSGIRSHTSHIMSA